LKLTPDGPEAAISNRWFLRRVVRFLVGTAGIRQFLDIGSGLPTQGNVHEIAHQLDPDVSVVYVDSDPMVLAHARALLAEAPTTTVIQADVREPDAILRHPEVRQRLDFDRPIGLLMLGILHHLHDNEDPGGIAKQFRDAMAPGSYLAISHFCNPGEAHPDISRRAEAVEKIFNESLGTGRWRFQDEIAAFFGDWEIVEPGLVPFPEWRPEADDPVRDRTDTYYTFVGGMARKP
jgi:SAM-dependent methyltransferase